MEHNYQNGTEMKALIAELYPICRSITGEGVRKTLRILQRYISLEIHEVPTGTQVFDWTIPKEWNIVDAYIKDPAGNKIVDFHQCNLHVLNYSVPVSGVYTLEELKSHIFTIPEQPDLIPYRTSYYSENWGFCMPHLQYEQLPEGNYEVLIDSSLTEGSLTYGELYIPGETQEEMIFSAHVCHPSLCNDNLSGIAVATFLAKHIQEQVNRKYSYRFIFAPGTIGAITWLARNEAHTDNIKFGLITSLLGAEGDYVYKKTRRGNAEIDRIMEFMLTSSGKNFEMDEFIPYGYDERQYCSPGFNLPVGNIAKARWGQFPEYHTSADNLQFVKEEVLDESLEMLKGTIEVLETNQKFINLNPKCEPQLGKRGLFDSISGSNMNKKTYTLALLWVLNQSDGDRDLLEIAERSGLSYDIILSAAKTLEKHDLLRPLTPQRQWV